MTPLSNPAASLQLLAAVDSRTDAQLAGDAITGAPDADLAIALFHERTGQHRQAQNGGRVAGTVCDACGDLRPLALRAAEILGAILDTDAEVTK